MRKTGPSATSAERLFLDHLFYNDHHQHGRHVLQIRRKRFPASPKTRLDLIFPSTISNALVLLVFAFDPMLSLIINDSSSAQLYHLNLFSLGFRKLKIS
jgi:hypothetical protein